MKIELGQIIIDIIRKKINMSDFLFWLKLKFILSNKYTRNHFNICLNIKKNNFEIKKISKNDIIISNNIITCITKTSYPWILNEIFGDNIYKFRNDINKNEKYILFDMGANHCYASLYFAQNDWCKNVFAFELMPKNIDYAKENLELNKPIIKNKIKLFEFGLGKDNQEIFAKYFAQRDAISSYRDDFVKSYAPEDINNAMQVKCEIKKSSEILKQIIEENNITENIIIKCDVEGAEYDIFEDLAQNYPEIFDKTVKIVGDTHLGFDRFYNIVKPYGFKITWNEQHENETCPFELSKDE